MYPTEQQSAAGLNHKRKEPNGTEDIRTSTTQREKKKEQFTSEPISCSLLMMWVLLHSVGFCLVCGEGQNHYLVLLQNFSRRLLLLQLVDGLQLLKHTNASLTLRPIRAENHRLCPVIKDPNRTSEPGPRSDRVHGPDSFNFSF